MAMITCHECSAEISDQAKACPKCGAPVKKDDVRKYTEYIQKIAINIIARRRYWWQGYFFTVAVFIGLVAFLELIEKENGPPPPLGVFVVIIFITWLARSCFFAVLARKLRKRHTIQELAEIWQVIGGFGDVGN